MSFGDEKHEAFDPADPYEIAGHDTEVCDCGGCENLRRARETHRERGLKPCPFCGSPDLVLSGWRDVAVRCGSCGAIGPNVRDKKTSLRELAELAREAWNLRT